MRVPGQKRVYAARFGAEISTAFEDWIETNLLEVTRSQIDRIVLNEYFIDEGTRRVVRRGEFTLDKVAQDHWTANRVPAGQEVDFVQVNLLVGAIIDLKIAGVRPKPAGMTGNLRDAAMAGSITQSDIQTLVGRGFFPTPEGGLLSNEGEVLVRTTEGVGYTLRFGEVVYGRGDAVRWEMAQVTNSRPVPVRTGTSSLRPSLTRRPSQSLPHRIRMRMPPGSEERKTARTKRSGWRRALPTGITSSPQTATTGSTSRAASF